MYGIYWVLAWVSMHGFLLWIIGHLFAEVDFWLQIMIFFVIQSLELRSNILFLIL
jgi:hypothetical protein